MHEFNATVQVAADHPSLAGHFPGRPVVPAVLLLELAAAALSARFGDITIRGVPAAKFLQPVLPRQQLQLRFRADLVRGHASFRFEHEGTLAARGELSFVQAASNAAGAAP